MFILQMILDFTDKIQFKYLKSTYFEEAREYYSISTCVFYSMEDIQANSR